MALLPTLFFPGDIRALQAAVRADLESTNETVKSCSSLDAATVASWNSFYTLTMGYCTVTVDGAGIDYATSILAPLWFGSTLRDIFGNSTDVFMNRGRAEEAELIGWQKKLQAEGCALKGPLHETPPDPPSDLANAIKWVGIGVAAVAGAYAVSRIVPVLAEGTKAVAAEVKALGGHLKSKKA